MPLSDSLIEHIQKLADMNVRLTRTDIWLLEQTFDSPATINELAKIRGVSYHAIYQSIKKLEDLKLVAYAFQVGREVYYKCHFDVHETSSTQLFLKYEKQKLSIEELVGLAASTQHTASKLATFFAYAIGHLYTRSVVKSETGVSQTPTGSEVRSYLRSLAEQYEEWSKVLRTLIEAPIFDNSDHVKDYLGEIDYNFATYLASSFQDAWNTGAFSTKGYTNNRNNKDEAIKLIKQWCESNGFEFHSEPDLS